jgi:hypothetical protein
MCHYIPLDREEIRKLAIGAPWPEVIYEICLWQVRCRVFVFTQETTSAPLVAVTLITFHYVATKCEIKIAPMCSREEHGFLVITRHVS